MPELSSLAGSGERAVLVPSFPCVTWPVQANMLTGALPAEHGVVANGFYWRERREVEMWTAGNDKISVPQIWDRLHSRSEQLTSAGWFAMLTKGCGADFVCMPAPVHNPDGSESLWCYTKPSPLYGELRDTLGHFPLQHFWGPLANIRSTAWIAESAVIAARRYRPRFFYIYLPHLDYAAQKSGPDSPPALAALAELDQVIGKLAAGLREAYAEEPVWMAAGEYVISPVDHVSFPNRVLREAGLLRVREEQDGEHLDLERSGAWALVDHQFSHVFVNGHDATTAARVADLFRGQAGIGEVLVGHQRKKYAVDHERSGDVLLISTANSWQAYYWWLDDVRAPRFARTVDIHRKPGYDPVELHFDFATKSIPLDATLVKGSHGAPAVRDDQQSVLLASAGILQGRKRLADSDVCGLVLDQLI
jgi:hypothetical protein